MRIFYAFTACAAFLIGSISMHAQTVKGTVKDDAGTLPGVVVKDAANTAGTSTDIDGNYKLKLKAGKHTLEFKMVGYTTQTREVTLSEGQEINLDITLQSEDSDLDEVVIVGYGVQRKREVTGSISKVDGKELTKLPVPSFEAALQGQAAGVAVTQSSGLAGSGSLVRIRGIASISAGGDPLYVIDGIPIIQNQFINGNAGALNSNPLASINPADIESVEILKDAAATGIYGSRGANGVILITTKRGTKTKKGVQFDFSTRHGIGVAASRPNMMNTDQYLAVRQEAWENDGGTGYVWLPGVVYESGQGAGASALERQQKYELARQINTDWVDETIGVGFKQNYNFGANYSTDKIALYTGLSYDDNGSYLIGNSYERISGRTNFDYTISKKLKILTSLSYSLGRNNRVDAAWSGGLGLAMSTALPYYPVTVDSTALELFGGDFEVGDYFMWNSGFTSPVAVREGIRWRTDEKRLISNLSVIYSPIKNLNIRLTGAYDYLDFSNNQFVPQDLFPNTFSSTATRNSTWSNNWNSSLTADYVYDINENHKITVLGGFELQEFWSNYLGRNYNFVDGSPVENDFETDSTVVQRFPGNRVGWTFVSTFARVNYSIKNRYFIQAVSRIDGSSRFGANSRYGYFPSLSAGWVVSDERWFNKTKFVNFLKVRAGWGKSGNSDIPADAQFNLFSNINNGITYNGQPILFPTQFGNADLQWENTSTLDATVEIGMLKDRLTAQVSLYRKVTTNALMNVSIPASTGFGNYWDNVAEILNRGIELTITSYNITKPNFEWKTDFNIARNYNELVDIGNYTPDAVSGGTNDSRVIVGKPIGSFYLMKFSHVDPETGLPVYLDANGNETFDYDNAQRQYVGDGLPEAIGGITNSFRYKQWDAQILATFSLGAKIFDSSGKRQMGVVTDWNMRTDVLDRWRQPGDEATFARLTLDETTYGLPSGFPWWNTSLFIYNADYLRIRNIAIGYTFKLKKESKLQNLRIGANATNVFTFTNFPGLDPELVRDFENPQDRNLSPNVTYLTPPQERSFNFSINANF